MFTSYLKIAYRNILKRKLYSVINAVGLSIGIAFCLLIYLFIADEKSFDQFHANKETIYRVDNKHFALWAFKNQEAEPYENVSQFPAIVASQIRDEVGGIIATTRYSYWSGILKNGDRIFNTELTGVDADFFRMFSFKLISGNREELFKNKGEIVLTQDAATKYFGTEDPLGKIMILDVAGEHTVTVAGVIEQPPGNSSITYGVLVPAADLQSWLRDASCKIFLQLDPSALPSVVDTNLNAWFQKVNDDNAEFRKQQNIPDELKLNDLYLTKLTGIHLDSKIKDARTSDPKYSFILGGIAILVLIIACINYVALALTGSSMRKTEVGIRKVSGAAKNELAFQFSIESLTLAFIAMALGLILVVTFLPAFNTFTGKEIKLSFANCVQFGGMALLLTSGIGVLAGSYPALYLSGLKPVEILKGGFTGKYNPWFSKPLLVVQFAFSAFLIMSSLVMYQQMRFITTKDLGYNQHQIVSIPLQQRSGSMSDALLENFRTSVSSDPNILSIAGASASFAQGVMTIGFQHKGEMKVSSGYIVDQNYISTLGIQILKGRDFDENIQSDMREAVIVNEAMVKSMNWTNPLGESINLGMGEKSNDWKVIGVVKDFHFLSLENDIGPVFLTMDTTFTHCQYILAKISPNDIPGTMTKLERTFKSVSPETPFDYSFVDENVELQYRSYSRWISIVGLATAFAIFISCLGLFGLAGINVSNRTKEISIRKVLGAELSNIFVLSINNLYSSLCSLLP